MSKHKHRQSDAHPSSSIGEEPSGPCPPAQAPETPPPAPPENASPPPAPDPLAALTVERDDLLARLQRVSADYLNYQKRAAREIAEAREFANGGLVKDLLVVVDDLERAIQAARASRPAVSGEAPPVEPDLLLTGVELVCQKLLAVLTGCGLKRIPAEGLAFDPLRHQAVVQEPSQAYPVPTVIRELQPGYEFKGRVLRPASVVVSAPAAGQAGKE